mgnify:CR=1 FL=1
MNITGFTKRSISSQRESLSYNFEFTPFSGIGSGEFGLSGTQVFKYSIANGKIFDTSGRFVSSYIPGEVNTISGNLSQKSFDCYVNSQLIELGQPVKTGEYNCIFANTNSPFNLNVFIYGVAPSYSLPATGVYVSSGSIITGNIINLNPANKFEIFNAYINQVGSPYFITGFSTGVITNSGFVKISSSDDQNSDYLLPIVLQTNFGDIPFSYFISGNQVLGLDTYLSISPDIFEITSPDRQNYTVYFSSFPVDPSISISLSYLSGITGNIYNLVSVVKTGESAVLTGAVSGVTTFSKFHSGVVSLIDPKTSINETGLGTGYLYTDPITGTGLVSVTFNERVYGFGTGAVTTNYLASGYADLIYSGNVGVAGSFLNGIAYNFAGTGNTPGFATGTVPVGTGTVFVRPTGTFSLPSGLLPQDYSTAYLSVSKVFNGPLYYDYVLTGLGFATGESITGVVNSRFSLDFEPAYYTFIKYFSGVVLGFGTNTGNFNPVLCYNAAEELATSGVLAGFYSWSGRLDCDTLNSLPRIQISGYPSTVIQGTGLFDSNQVVTIVPSGGFSSNENSLYALSNTTRTVISNTETGYFSGVFGLCGSLNGVWREKVVNSRRVTGLDSTFYSPTNSLSELNFESYITGSGNMGLFGSREILDSGSMKFTITGSGSKIYTLRGLSDSIGGPKGISLYLFKETGLIGIFDSYEGALDLAMYNKQLPSFYDVGGVFELSSGNYTIVSLSHQLEEPTIQFSQPIFSGCESDGYLRFEVTRSGDLRTPSSVEIVHYNEITAHSGREYFPITGVIRWGVNQSFPQYFDVPIYNDAHLSKDGHMFTVEMSNITNATFGGPSIATGHIIDDDSYGVLFQTGSIENELTISTGVGGYISGISGSIVGISGIPLGNVCNPISSPVFFNPIGLPIIGSIYEKDYAPARVICTCPLPSTGLPQITGSGIFPGNSGITSARLCGAVSTFGTTSTPDFLYLGSFCSNTCFLNSSFTASVGPPQITYRELFIPICNFPSGFLEIGSGYSFSGMQPPSFTTGEKAGCCPLGVFLNVRVNTTGPGTWEYAASGVALDASLI